MSEIADAPFVAIPRFEKRHGVTYTRWSVYCDLCGDRLLFATYGRICVWRRLHDCRFQQ